MLHQLDASDTGQGDGWLRAFKALVMITRTWEKIDHCCY